jgi:ATP-dependent DNA helicase RecG
MIDLSGYKRLELTEAEVRRYLAEEEGPYYDRKSLWDRSGATDKVRDRSTVREEIAEYLAAFANADGGLLVLGVEDDGTPTGHGYPEEAILSFLRAAKEKVQPPLNPRAQIIRIDGKELLLFEIESTPEAVHCGGRCPYRSGHQVVKTMSQEAINNLKKVYQLASFEQRPRAEFLDQDIDQELAKKVFSRTPFKDRTPEENFLRYGLAVRRNGRFIWRNAGILLFGREEQFASYHPHAGVRMFRVEGTERRHGARQNAIEKRVEGPLPLLIERAHDYIRSQIRKSAKLHDLFFREMPEYPEFAWQEALINAVAHRDYLITTREIEVWMFDDRMEVKSPGGLVEGITLEKLRERKSNHASRNPLIVRVLVDYSLMREQGEGIPRMMEEMETSFLHLPELELINGDFQVRLKNTPIFEVGSSEWVNLVKGLPITDRQRRVLIAKGKGGFTNQDYKKLNQLDRDTAYQEIKTMLDAGIIESRGKTRGTKYFLSLTVTRIVTLILGRLPKLREFLAEKEFISNVDYRTLFNLTRRQARDELKALCDKGYLILVGERRGAKYQKGPAF